MGLSGEKLVEWSLEPEILQARIELTEVIADFQSGGSLKIPGIRNFGYYGLQGFPTPC